jgi:hypothetical protein
MSHFCVVDEILSLSYPMNSLFLPRGFDHLTFSIQFRGNHSPIGLHPTWTLHRRKDGSCCARSPVDPGSSIPPACMRNIVFMLWEHRGLLPGQLLKFSSLPLAHITASSTGVLVRIFPHSVISVILKQFSFRIEGTHCVTFVGRRIWRRLTVRHCHDHRRNTRSSRENGVTCALLCLLQSRY